MRRHEPLIPLTRDHYHALVQVRRLRAAAEGSEDDRRTAAKQFLDFFHTDTIHHFREEEEVVFPLVVEAHDVREILERVMMEHLYIHALVNKLQAEFEEAVPTRDPLVTLASALENHVRFEEKVVFPLIEQRVGGPALEAVALRPRDRARAG